MHNLAVNLFLDTIIMIGSYIIPKQRGTLLFGTYNNKFAGNTKSLYLESINSKYDVQPYWLIPKQGMLDELKQNDLPIAYKYSLKGFFLILRAEFLIIEGYPVDILYDGRLSPFSRIKFIQTWHGIGFKPVGILMLKEMWKHRLHQPLFRVFYKIKYFYSKFFYRKYNLILATSPETKQHFEKTFISDRVRILGYPRNDIFFRDELLCTDYNQKLRLNGYKKVYLYAPTFRDDPSSIAPFSTSGLGFLNDYLRKTEQILLVKNHPFDKTLLIPSSLTNIRDVTHEVSDVQELLVHIDVLISDFSSIPFDFVLTNRPIIYYPYDYEAYIKKSRILLYDYFQELPGPFANDEKELLELIKTIDIWPSQGEFKIQNQNFKDKFHSFQDGNACQRVLAYLKEL